MIATCSSGGIMSRRRLALRAAAAMGLWGATSPAAWALNRSDSRGRYRLAADFAAPLNAVVLVPFDTTVFQSGADLTLQSDGKILVNTTGLYEVTLSIDWDLKAGRDIGLRQTGVRRQRKGQPDGPPESHDRVIYGDLPGSAAATTARYQGAWGPLDIPLGAAVSTDVPVAPSAVARPGDVALASHSQLRDGAIPPDALAALIVQAKVVAADKVRVTFINQSVAEGIHIPAGNLNVMAMSATQLAGGSGDGWHPLHGPSVALEAGDKLYATVRHHVAGSLVQATNMSFLQVDRLE